MRHFRSLAMGDGPEADAKEAKLLELIGARSEALCEKLVASLLDRFGRCAREAPLPPSPPPPPAWQLLLRPLLLPPLPPQRTHYRRRSRNSWPSTIARLMALRRRRGARRSSRARLR